MTFEDALTALESLLKADEPDAGSPFTPTERRILQAAWYQENYQSVASQLYLTEGHVKDVAAALWKHISAVVHTKVTKRTLRGILETFLAEPPWTEGELTAPAEPDRTTIPRSTDWADAPDPVLFLGRQQELKTLEQWIVDDRCQVVALLGMGGIGKTALAARLSRRIQTQFDGIFWRSLLNAPKLTDILQELLLFLSPQQEAAVPSTLEGLLLSCLHHLRQRRYLVILDNGETLLAEGGEQPYRPGYSDYDQLFKRLGEAPHASCLLLTSREKPPAIAQLESPRRPLRSLTLTGLAASDAQKIVSTFQEFEASSADWQALLDLYEGHPLALELVAKHIAEVFFGDIRAFLQQGQPIFRDIGTLLNWHFERLSAAEVEVLYWLSISREPVSLQELQTLMLTPPRQAQLPSVLQSLQRRLPLVQSDRRLTLQPVLLEHVTAQFVQHMGRCLATADLKALDQFCLLQASAREHRRQTQLRLIVQPVLEHYGAERPSQTSAESHLLQLLAALKQSAREGYGAGNVLNLLVTLGYSLKSQDLSQLTLREVDLQGVALCHSNFTNVRFDRVTFTQNLKGILAVAMNTQADLLAASDSDGSIHLYETSTGRYCANLRDPHSQTWIYSLDFSPEGRHLLSSGLDQTLRLWDCQTGELLRLWSQDSQVLAVAYHPRGDRFASAGSDGNVSIWDINGTKPIKVFSGHQNWIWSLAFDPGGRRLASTADDGTTRLWDVQHGQVMVLQTQQQAGRAVAISPDGQLLATAGNEHTVALWCSNTGQPIGTLQGHRGLVRAISFHGNGSWLVSTGYDGTIRIWDIATQRCLKTLHSNGTHCLDALALGQSGDDLIVGSKDHFLQLWDLATGQCVRSLQGFVCGTASLALDATGQRLVSSGLDHFIWRWDLAKSRPLPPLSGHQSNVWAIAISPDGRTLASGSYDCTLKLWDVASGTNLHTGKGHRHFIRSVAFSATGAMVATGSSDGTVKLWETTTGQCLKTLQGHEDKVQAVLFTGTGQHLLSAGNDGQIRRWDLAKGALVEAIAASTGKVYALALPPQEGQVVSGDTDGIVRLWDWKNGRCLRVWAEHQQSIWSVAVSPDGDWIASSSNDKTVRVWHIPTGNRRHVFQFAVPVGAIAFHPASNWLVCGCFNQEIAIYSLATGERRQTLHIPRPYEGMQIRGAKGLSTAQFASLYSLGAIG